METSLKLLILLIACSNAAADESINGYGASGYSEPSINSAPPPYSQAGSYPPAETNAIDNSLQTYEEPSGFGVQTGYEGYLIPEQEGEETGLIGIVSGLFPQLARFGNIGYSLLSRSSTMFLGAAGFVLAGGLFTTAMCVFTPLCTISFLGLARENVRDNMRSLLTPEKMNAAATFITEALDRYKKLNDKVNKRSANKRSISKRNITKRSTNGKQ